MSGLDGIGTTPVVDPASLPASVRNGTPEHKKAYEAALGFERVLVGQLTQSMMKTTSTGDDSGEDASTKAMKQNLPGILTDALMGAGGIGLAAQLDSSWTAAAADVKKTSLTSGSGGATAAPASATSTSGQGGATA